MTTRTNHRWLLSRRPKGMPTKADFTYESVEQAPPADGEVLVGMRYLSLDPAMRGWMNDVPSYVPPVKLGAVMRAYGVGQVLASAADGFAEGDWVTAPSGLQSIYHATRPRELRKIDPEMCPVTWHLGAVGMTGLTAYFGLFDIGAPKEGETVLVSGAAGAVGSVVGQLAKVAGCRVVGIAGGAEKCAYLTDALGFDAAVDYKASGVRKALAAACPDGVDVYFDNVGGPLLEAALWLMNDHGRLPLCGAISQYNDTEPTPGPRNLMLAVARRLRLQGFIVMDYGSRYNEAVPKLAKWALSGQIQTRETIVQGLESFPVAFERLFSGDKIGKLMLEV